MVVSKDLARQLDGNPFWNKCIDSCSLLSTGIIDSLKKEKINNYYANKTLKYIGWKFFVVLSRKYKL